MSGRWVRLDRRRARSRRPTGRGRASVLARDAGAAVGISLYHTVGDRERAIEQINTGFNEAYGDLFRAMGWRQDRPEIDETTPLFQLWTLSIRPTIDEWKKFRDDQSGSFWARFSTSWETYESWQDRLKKLRELIRSAIGRMATVEPRDLPTTIFADVADDARKIGAGALDVTKTALYVGIGVAGVALAVSLSGRARGVR